MDSHMIQRFEKMGARVKITVVKPVRAIVPASRWSVPRAPAAPVSIDIRRDGAGEFFDVRHRKDVQVEVIDVKPADRHLLLLARVSEGTLRPQKSKFLCGHDERAWFVAAVPESAGAKDVQSAKDALKPKAVWDAIRLHGVSPKDRDRRRTEAFVRQGEWFFIPCPRVNVKEKLALKNEPIRRGNGKPHVCQFLFREGGELVYVSGAYPNGLTEAHFRALPEPERQRHRWRTMMRDARAYVKGSVRHPDHKTVWLKFWHEVAMNTETQAAAMRHVAFLD
jgi:hypothetical protein